MADKDYHVFFSYARKDNSYARKDNQGDHEGWISRFHDVLKQNHKRLSGRQLETFFDTEDIDSGELWKSRLKQGLRRSRLFLAFLSKNYLKSEVCRWEWEQYLLREHSVARGEDGIIPLYFVTIDELNLKNLKDLSPKELILKAPLSLKELIPEKDNPNTEILERWLEEIKKRNLGEYCHLEPWFEKGAEVLLELDAGERLDAARQVDKATKGALSLAERVKAINLRICRRLDRIQLADQVIGNVVRSYEHFVGRHCELRQLHDHLINGRRGLITAAFGPGGLGKSALARQYAVAYADFYAAGGIWELACSGVGKMGDALMQLHDQPELGQEGFSLDEQGKLHPDVRAQNALYQLQRITKARLKKVKEQLLNVPERHTPENKIPSLENARCLLILDNVDCPELLSQEQINLLPPAEWLQILVTTRLGAEEIGDSNKLLATVEVHPLSQAEGYEMLQSFMPDGTFPDKKEQQAAEQLVAEVGGYTIVLELIGAYVQTNWQAGARLSKYLAHLQNKGLTETDRLGKQARVANRIDYQKLQVKQIVTDTLESLKSRLQKEASKSIAEAAQTTIEFASLLQPDQIPVAWLHQLVLSTHRETLQDESRDLSPWGQIYQALLERRLLIPAAKRGQTENEHEMVRIHRVIAAHIANDLTSKKDEVLWPQIESLIDDLADGLKARHERGEKPELPVQEIVLVEQLRYLIQHHNSPRLLRATGQATELVGTHGSLASAIELMERVLRYLKIKSENGPKDRGAFRDFSFLQIKLGYFYIKRGSNGDTEKALNCFTESLNVAKELLKRNPQSIQAAGNVSASQEGLGHFYLWRGKTGDTEKALNCYTEALKEMQKGDPQSAYTARNISYLQWRLGDCYLERGKKGDAERVLKNFADSLDTAEKLLKRNPQSVQALRDVSILKERLGTFYLQRNEKGDANKAFEYFTDSLETLLKLQKRNPQSVQALRDVSIPLERMGNYYLARGKTGDDQKALKYFINCLEVKKNLLKRNPRSVQALRDVSVLKERLGTFYLQRNEKGDANKAFEYFTDSLEIRKELLERNPDSFEAARDVSALKERLGTFYLQRNEKGDANKAFEYFTDSLETLLKLQKRNPQSVQALRDVSIPLERMGNYYLARGKTGDDQKALKYFINCLEVKKNLLKRNPRSVQALRDVSRLHGSLSDIYAMRGKKGDAVKSLRHLTDSLKMNKALLKRNPQSPDDVFSVSLSHFRLAAVYEELGQNDEAYNHLKISFGILNDFVQKSSFTNRAIRMLHAQLRQIFEE